MSLRHSGEEESALADLSWGLLFVFLTLTIILIAESGNGPQDCLKNAQAVEDCICKATEWCSMPEPEEPDPQPPEDEPLPPCGSVHKELLDEFRGDLPVWGAALDPDASIRFFAPEVLFEKDSDEVSDAFTAILAEFTPRYIRTIRASEDRIDRIVIEGHTSSEWGDEAGTLDSYRNNMVLSTRRAVAVMRVMLQQEGMDTYMTWRAQGPQLRSRGAAFEERVLAPAGNEDQDASRRVIIRIQSDKCALPG